MKFLLFFFLSFCIVHTSHAQKCENLPLPPNFTAGRLLYVFDSTLYASIDPDGRVNRIIQSNDNGQTWTLKTILPAGGFIDNSPWVKNGVNLYAGGCDSDLKNSYILRSTDNGETWNIYFRYGTGGDFRACCASGDTIVFQYDNGPISCTIDGGKSLVINEVSLPFNFSPMNFQLTDNYLTVSNYYIILATSTDLGTTWQQDIPSSKPNGTSLSFIGGGRYFVTADRTYHSLLFYNTDLGSHWDTCRGLPYGQHNLKKFSGDRYLFDLYTPLANTIEGNAVYFSSDNGSNWRLLARDFPSDATDFFSGSEYYFLSSWGSIWRFPNSGLTTVPNQSMDHSLALRGTPNPVSSSLRITYSIPDHAQTSIDVVDITGQTVARMLNAAEESGVHEIIWNTESFHSGTYMVRLAAAGKYATMIVQIVK